MIGRRTKLTGSTALGSNRVRLGGLLVGALLLLLPLHFADASNAVGNVIMQVVYNLALAIGGTVLTIGSLMLDGAIHNLIVEMGTYFAEGQGNNLGAAVALGWALIRDLLNMCFIFGLIYIGIKTILNSEDSGTRRALGLLVAAALLVNFSLYFTQAFIDFTNYMAVQVYGQIVNSQPADDSVTNVFQSPLSEAFLDAVGFSSIFSTGEFSINELSFGKGMMFSFMMFVFLVVAGVAFGMGAILVVTRFIALLLYMVFSPILFIGWVLPWFKSWSSKWWEGLFRYGFFGPIYIFMLYLSLLMLRGLVEGLGSGGQSITQTTQSSLAGSLANDLTIGYAQIVLYFIIMIGLLWASLKIGDKLSIAGGRATSGALTGMGQTVQNSLQGMAYRNTVGRGMNRLRKGYEALDRTAESDESGLKAGAKRLGARTLRSIGGGEAGRKAVVKARDYGAGGVGWGDLETQNEERAARATRGNRLNTIKGHLSGSAESPDSTKIGDLTDAQLIEMMKDPKDRKLVEDNIHLLKPNQIKAVRDSDKINDGVRNNFNEKLKTELTNKAKDSEETKKIFKQYRKKLGELPADVLKDKTFAKNLTDPSVLKQVANIEGITTDDLKVIKSNVENAANNEQQEDLKRFWSTREGRYFGK